MKHQEYTSVKGLEGSEPISQFRQTSSCFNATEINPALGCEFGCVYCSMYAQEGQMNHFPIKVFTDYPKYIQQFIEQNQDKHLVFNFTPKSDALAPALIESGVTQEILDIFTKYRKEFYIITKSGMPPKDVQEKLILAKDIGQVIISSGLPDESYRSMLEPSAPTIEERMEFASFCRQENIKVAGLVAPYLPIPVKGYKEEVIRRYHQAGVEHLSLQLLKLSAACLENMCTILGDTGVLLREAYDLSESNSITWKLPGQKTIDRFYAKKEVLKTDLQKFKRLANEAGLSVSACNDVQKLIEDPNFNKEAGEKGITCVGFKRRQ